MKKTYLFLSILLLSILSSCDKKENCDFGEYELLDYNGPNAVGQQLVSKITERDQGTKELNQIVSPSERELLFDYAIFGQGFGFGIHYAVPVRDIKTGNIEGCIIYQVNKTSSENFDLKGKVDAPLFIDVEKYKELPISQAGCSVFFRKWKEQGLEVATELYRPNKCFSRTVSEKEEEIQAYSLSSTSYFATIRYWLDLRGYIPAGATAYAIGLDERKKIFRRNIKALETSNTFQMPEIRVTMDRVEILIFVTGGLGNSFRNLLVKYMNECTYDFGYCQGGPKLEYDIIINNGSSGSSSSSGSGSSGGSGSGSTPGGGDGSWNTQTHHGILKSLKAKLNLDDLELEILISANKYCDNLLEGNQFSSKAFFHAMKRSANLSEAAAREEFKEHLKRYLLFLLDKKEMNYTNGIYELGIVIHGIVDSFCPGHKGFQYYSLANFSEHANQDKGELSPNQVFNSIDIVRRIYYELSRPDATEATVNKVIGMWEEAYNKNLEENN